MSGVSCEELRAHLLEADPAVIRALPAELERHVAGCASCREAVARVSAGLEEVGARLDAAASRLTLAEALELAREDRRARTARPRALVARGLRWAPAPAAVALAVWVAVRASGPTASPTTGIPAMPAPSPPVAAAFSVEAPVGGRVAVFQTKNPNIRVVWLYGSQATPDRE